MPNTNEMLGAEGHLYYEDKGEGIVCKPNGDGAIGIDLAELLADRPFFQHPSATHQKYPKKLIFSDPSFLYWQEDKKKAFFQKIKILLEAGFELYVSLPNYCRKCSLDDLEWMEEVQLHFPLASTKEIQTHAAQQNASFTRENTLILDYHGVNCLLEGQDPENSPKKLYWTELCALTQIDPKKRSQPTLIPPHKSPEIYEILKKLGGQNPDTYEIYVDTLKDSILLKEDWISDKIFPNREDFSARFPDVNFILQPKKLLFTSYRGLNSKGFIHHPKHISFDKVCSFEFEGTLNKKENREEIKFMTENIKNIKKFSGSLEVFSVLMDYPDFFSTLQSLTLKNNADNICANELEKILVKCPNLKELVFLTPVSGEFSEDF